MPRRIESKTSRTAEFTCLVRALSYLEKRERYKSGDNVSLLIMNDIIRPLLRFPVFKRAFLRPYRPGMYEYVIARTKTMDAAFRRALEQGAEQILIFGAGFDSRGIRLNSGAPNVRVFELDAPVTQAAKLARYRRKKIAVPDNLVFLPIDFDRDSLPQRLEQAGFAKGRPSLFLLEGLTMYLQPESAEDTFRVIAEFAGPGSRVVFDHIYASVVRRENLYAGEAELYRSVEANGERFCFGLEKGRVEEFLSAYGFRAEAILDAEALEELYFSGGEHVNGTHCIVIATR